MPIIRQGVLRQIAFITNKFLSPTQIQRATNTIWDTTTGLLKTEALVENSVRVLFWISKALVSRLAQTEEVLEHLISLLPDRRLGLATGQGFSILLAPDEVFSKQNGATIRLLANQKVFDYCIPRFAKSIRQANDSAKRNYLIALSGILKYVGTAILMTDVDTLLPLLLQSLDLKAPDVKSATIETLIVISQESAQAIEGHVSSVVTRLLEATIPNETNEPVSLSSLSQPHHVKYKRDSLLKTKKTESPPQRPPLPAPLPQPNQRKRSAPAPGESHQRAHDRIG